MPPVITLDANECQAILARWQKDGPNDEERDNFLKAALSLLLDDAQAASLADSISNIAQSAADIDKTFSEVQAIIWLFAIFDWSDGEPLLDEWTGCMERWRSALKNSIGVASTTADVLKRFDEVYLAKIESIQAENDRLAAIALLIPFIAELENNDQSASMSREFLDLKRDVEAFVAQFNSSALEKAINPMLKDIEALEEEIRAAHKALAASSASIVTALGLGAKASPVIASLKAQREKKVERIRHIHRATSLMNELVLPSATVRTRLDGETTNPPDIGLLIQELVVFADLWASIRSQTVQFNEQLKGGLGAATNARFKTEVKLAREQSRPLQTGLKDYIRQLETWVK